MCTVAQGYPCLYLRIFVINILFRGVFDYALIVTVDSDSTNSFHFSFILITLSISVEKIMDIWFQKNHGNTNGLMRIFLCRLDLYSAATGNLCWKWKKVKYIKSSCYMTVFCAGTSLYFKHAVKICPYCITSAYICTIFIWTNANKTV